MMPRILARLMFLGSSAGLLVSTITTGWLSATSSMISGSAKPQCLSTKAASVLGWPSSTGLAFTPLISFRYHAQMIGDPVLSVSGEVWPKTAIVIAAVLGVRSVLAAYRTGILACHGAVGGQFAQNEQVFGNRS